MFAQLEPSLAKIGARGKIKGNWFRFGAVTAISISCACLNYISEQAERLQVRETLQQQEQIATQFLAASGGGNLQDLLALLAKDVTFWADGGGRVAAALKPLHGAMKVARFLLAIQSKLPTTTRARLAQINGQPSILLDNGEIHTTIAFKILEGYIQEIYSVRNPDKLKHLKHLTEGGDRRTIISTN